MTVTCSDLVGKSCQRQEPLPDGSFLMQDCSLEKPEIQVPVAKKKVQIIEHQNDRGPTTHQLKFGKLKIHWALPASSVTSDSANGCFSVTSSHDSPVLGERSGVDWLRASTVSLCWGVVILFLCFEEDYSVQAQIQIKTSFLQVVHWIKRRVASNYQLSPHCRVICIHPWLVNS